MGGLTQKLKELENNQAQECDKLVIYNKSMDQWFSDQEGMVTTLLAQTGSSSGKREGIKQYDPNSGVRLGPAGTILKWKSSR